jgi:hypothetical protein
MIPKRKLLFSVESVVAQATRETRVVCDMSFSLIDDI